MITRLTKWRIALNNLKFALWSLTAEKIRRNRCEFDFIKFEAKCYAEDE